MEDILIISEKDFNRKPRIACVGPGSDFYWTEFGPRATKNEAVWIFFKKATTNFLEKIIKGPSLTTIMSYYRCIKYIKTNKADLLLTHSPDTAFWCALFIIILRVNIKHIAWSFNFLGLPKGLRQYLCRIVYSKVDKFIVYSNMEVNLYSSYFRIEKRKIDFVRWGVGEPPVYNPGTPIKKGDYICAIGFVCRDYQTLVNAIKSLPYINLVLVLYPQNLKYIQKKLPPNIEIYKNMSLSECMNLLKFSKFMVLPLKEIKTAHGHRTIVSAMSLKKAIIITKSPGLEDYVIEGDTAVTYRINDSGDLAGKIKLLWNDEELCKKLGKNGEAFASKYCSENTTAEKLKAALKDFGIIGNEKYQS